MFKKKKDNMDEIMEVLFDALLNIFLFILTKKVKIPKIKI